MHLHTQYNRDIPWAEIDMDFMNLNQSAHGDREFGFIGSRMRLNRKVVVGHWQDADVQRSLGVWARAACAWADLQGARVARFGDNMREVAVTEGDKVEAQIRLGYDVNGYGVGDLVQSVNQVTDAEIDRLVAEYDEQYAVMPDPAQGRQPAEPRCARRPASSWACGAFLEEGDFKAFTTTFEDLHGLAQLPGLAVQRLMADGYGFGAEGDWKTAALVRAMKVMAAGLPGGTSFMEDYTYHLDPGRDEGAGRAHAGSVLLDRRRAALAGDPPAVDRRQGRPGPPGVRRANRPGDQRLDDRHGQPLPPDRQRGGCGAHRSRPCPSCRWRAPCGCRAPI